MTKKINPNLTAEQKLILFEEGTELAGSSELNHEKRDCLLYTSPSPRDYAASRMPSSA